MVDDFEGERAPRFGGRVSQIWPNLRGGGPFFTKNVEKNDMHLLYLNVKKRFFLIDFYFSLYMNNNINV